MLRGNIRLAISISLIALALTSCQGRVIMPKPDDSWLWKGVEYADRTSRVHIANQ